MAVHTSISYSIVLTFIFIPYFITAQQLYTASNCPKNDNTSSALGYDCNGVNSSCESFIVYKTQPPYNTISSIAFLLSANASQISAINKIADNVALESNSEVIVPVMCSCVDSFYQADSVFTVQRGDSYYLIANNTFQGLSTCNAIRVGARVTIYPNQKLVIPLRCACPTRSQINDGIRSLITYVIHPGQNIAQIARNLGADVGQTLEANGKSEQDAVIYPFTTLLVPVRSTNFTTHLVPLLEQPTGPGLNSTVNNGGSSKIAVAVGIPVIVILLLLIIGACICIYRRKRAKYSQDLEEFIDIDSLKFEFKTIRNATDNFSHHNKLGQGGFGGVYKGKLANGQEVAVKRLSSDSGQGIEEFKTEVLLVEKLQHKNLVKLLGFCLHGHEKLLVYELLPNASLDKVLLDRNRKPSLDWETRYKIILGIARGLLYLHEDSRLKIIHRDLKLSNILLDKDMNPKIADFGLARLVGRDQIQADTSKIAGTYGYMAPEYVLTGRFSIMSDVYSFGVLALEIVSGHACSSTTFPFEEETLCVRAWRLWKTGEILNLVDSRLESNYISEEVKRCVHIGLLCIQEDANRRPMMAPIVSALNGHQVVLSEPEPPYVSLPTLIQYGSNQDGLKPSNDVSKIEDDNTEIYPR